MVLKPLIPEVPGTYILRPGDPGAPGGPGGAAAPGAGSGWEVGVYGADSGYGSLLAMVPTRLWNNFTFTKMLDDQGSGTLQLAMDDPFWNNTNLPIPRTPTLIATFASTSAGTSFTFSPNQGPRAASQAQGVLAIVQQSGPATVTLTDSAGNTYAQVTHVSNGSATYIFYLGSVNAFTSSNVFTFGSASTISCNIAIYSVPVGFIVDTSATNTGTSNSPNVTIPAQAIAGEYLMGVFGNAGGISPTSGPGGWVPFDNATAANNLYHAGYTAVSSTTGATAVSAGYGSSVAWTAIGLAIKPTPVNNLLTDGQFPSFLLNEEHVWRVFQDGIARFDFLGETITEQLVDQTENRIATVTGPGTIASLAWAIAAPPGFPSSITYKTDALADSFSEINTSGQYVVDYGLWNASAPTADIAINPAGSIQLIGTNSGTVLGSTQWDATNTLLSAQVTPIISPDANNVTLNGSQLTQMYVQSLDGNAYYAMIGMSATSLYAQYKGPDGTFTQVIATTAQYISSQQANFQYAYWQISEVNGTFFFWVSADGQTWKKVWSHARGWSGNPVGVYFASTYTGSTTEFATITSINADVVTSSLGGATYINQPIMSIYLQTLNAAKARGTVPWVTTQFSTTQDSFNNPWADSQSVQIQNGTDLYSLFQAHTAMIDADYIMEPGFRLVVGLPSATTPNSGSVTLGYDRSATVRFYEAGGETQKQRQRVRNQIQNLIGVINTDGVTLTASNAPSEALWGQREAWIQAAAQVTAADINIVASAAVQQQSSEILSWTMQIVPNQAGRTVFKDFSVGDWVGLERPDYSAVDAVRVTGIAVSVDQDGNETHELTLVSYIQWLEQRLQYIATKMGGGFINANGTTAISNNAQGSTLQAPTVFNPTLQSLGQPNTSVTGQALVVAPSGVMVPAGSADPATGATVNMGVSGAAGSSTISQTGVVVAAPNAGSPLNSNPHFLAGSLAGWQGVNATLATVTPAAGLPAETWAVQVTPTSNGVVATAETALPLIPVQGGEQYTLSAYVNLPTQADMHVTTSVTWEDVLGNVLRTDSQSTIVPASTWVQLSFQETAPGPAYDTQVKSASPVAWWKLSDGSGATSAADSSGYGNNGTPSNITFHQTFTPVPGNTCASFNGTTSKVVSSYYATGMTAFSAEAWVNLNGNTQSGFPRFVSNSNTDSDTCGFELYLNSSNNSLNAAIGNGLVKADLVSAASAIPSTGWQHVALTWDGTIATLYLNGVSVASTPFSGTMAPGTAASTVIGTGASYTGDWFHGLIGEVALYPAALSPTAIAMHAANLTTPGSSTGAASAVIAVGPTVSVTTNPMQAAAVILSQPFSVVNSSSTQVTQTGTVITDGSGNVRVISGLQPDGTVTTVEVNGPAPEVPDSPTVASIPTGLVVAWDGLLSGLAPLSDFMQVQVHVSTSSGFTPTSATLQHAWTTSGYFVVNNLTPGTTYYVVLVAINNSGVPSGQSAQVSGQAGYVTSAELAPWAVQAVNVAANQFGLNMVADPQFTNASLNAIRIASPSLGTWTTPSNTAVVTEGTTGRILYLSTPAGLWLNPGEQYYVSVQVTSTGATGGTVGIGIADTAVTHTADATFTFTGAATQTITGVVTIPAGMGSTGFIRLFVSGDATHTATLTFSKPLCQPAQLFSPTIEGTDWIVNASGFFFYSGTPAANNLACSVVPGTASVVDPFGNEALAGFTTYVNVSTNYYAFNQDALNTTVFYHSGDQTSWPSFATLNALSVGSSAGAITTVTQTLGGTVVSTGGTPSLPTVVTTDSWNTATLTGSMTGTIQYKLNPDKTVMLRGEVVTSANTVANTTVFTLPSGYRPAATFAFITPNNMSGYTSPARVVSINSSGVVTVIPAGTNGNFFLLDGIRIPVD